MKTLFLITMLVFLPLSATIAAPDGAGSPGSDQGTAVENGPAAEDGSAGLEKSPPPHKHYKKKGAKVVVHGHGPVVVARPVVHHRRAVVVRSAPVVVHTVKAVPVHERRVVETHSPWVRRSRAEDSMLGIGIRLSGTAVDGQKLNLATVENPTLWGLGLQFRGKVSPNVGIELGADWLEGRGADMTQTTVPLMLSVMYYFVPDGGLRAFGLLGAGVNMTALEYDAGFRTDVVELAAQAGGGVELRLSPEFGLSADLRFMGLYRDMGATTTIRQDCYQQVGPNAQFCNGLSSFNGNDKFDVGAQFMVGANLYF